MSISQSAVSNPISTHAPAGGATGQRRDAVVGKIDFYSRPCGRGDRSTAIIRSRCTYFYSRPCGRGDAGQSWRNLYATRISTHAPAGGATKSRKLSLPSASNFYSRPCGRGDPYIYGEQLLVDVFLLTPLREGRHNGTKIKINQMQFLLTPLREGRHRQHSNGA